tara:strand:- start:23466 stop:25019 length:1554 start_codon:yes stop_codon:yes gene_type:complete
LNVIITLAGHSLRFKEAGLKTPKFLISIDGKPMIEHVINMFDYSDTFHFVLNEDQLLDNPSIKTYLASLSAKTTITVIKSHNIGPTYSALQVEEIPDDEEVIVSYCDFTVNWDYELFKRTVHGYDGAIPSFQGFHPASFGDTYYAYLKINNNYELVKLREKKSFTNKRHKEHASVGIYYFANWKVFQKYSKIVLDTYKDSLQEAYTSLHYNHMVEDDLKIKVFKVENFICWGTPDDLNQYTFWSNYFNKNKNIQSPIKKNNLQINIIPMAGEGSRFRQYGYRLSKPLIPVGNEPMVLTSCKSFPSASKWVFLPKEKDYIKYPIDDALNSFNNKIIPVNRHTSGQAATCLIAKKEISLDNPLFIASCDYKTLYSFDKWEEIIKDKSIDGAIWTYRLKSFLTKDPKAFAYCKTYKNSLFVSEVVEKDVISNNPSEDPMVIGSFWFRRGSDFIFSANYTIENDLTINGEHYIGNSINILLEKGKKFVCFDVDAWISFGDPFELKVYEYWENYFNNYLKWN